MSTIAEKLTQLNTIKQNQKTYLGTSENDFSKYLGLFKDKIEEVLVNAQQLYFKNPNSTDATFKLNSKSSHQSVQYSLDYGKTWTELENQTPITIPGNGGICLIRGKLTGDNENNNLTKFYIRDYDLECHGNVMSIYDYENPFNTSIVYKNALRILFEGCNKLLSAPTLPATTISNGCYLGMFNGCTKLSVAPALPATTLGTYCYSAMFKDCIALTASPALPATSLKDYCYERMFSGCSNLAEAPELKATKLVAHCYEQMFRDCTSLTIAPELPATTLTTSCYSNMFRGCTRLTNTPMLPATTLANGCYNSMFQGCIKLNYIKCLATNISATNCTTNWVNRVAATGTFVKASSMSSWTTGANGIPTNWTVQNA